VYVCFHDHMVHVCTLLVCLFVPWSETDRLGASRALQRELPTSRKRTLSCNLFDPRTLMLLAWFRYFPQSSLMFTYVGYSCSLSTSYCRCVLKKFKLRFLILIQTEEVKVFSCRMSSLQLNQRQRKR
jgi:hypothetical protein